MSEDCKIITETATPLIAETLKDMGREIERLKVRVKKAEEMARFYGTEENYHEDFAVKFPFRSTKVEADRGATARAFLAEKDIGNG